MTRIELIYFWDGISVIILLMMALITYIIS